MGIFFRLSSAVDLLGGCISMRTFLIRGLAVAASTLVLAACYEITPHRYEAGSGPNTVRIGAGTSLCGAVTASASTEAESTEVETDAVSTDEVSTDAASTDAASTEAATHVVEVFIDGESVGSATADSTGSWSVDVAAPTEIGTHVVTASCDGSQLDLPSESSFNEIIVEPPFDPTADPAQYTVSTTPDSVTFSGRFCINSTPFEEIATGSSESSTIFSGSGEIPTIVIAVGLPTVTVDFNGTQKSQVASSTQPYDETWSIEFPNPPNAPGTYTAHVTCGFDDLPNIAEFSSELSSLSDAGDVQAQDIFDLLQFSKVTEADVPVEVLPDPTTTTTTPSGTEANAATPVVAQPHLAG